MTNTSYSSLGLLLAAKADLVGAGVLVANANTRLEADEKAVAFTGQIADGNFTGQIAEATFIGRKGRMK